VSVGLDLEIGQRAAVGDRELQLDDVECVTASVTGCSTWIRPLSSRKKTSSPSTRNSAVPALS
jgi:hypothetical protein